MVQTLAKIALLEPGEVGIVLDIFGLQFHDEAGDFLELVVVVAPGIGLLIAGHCQLLPVAVASKVAVFEVQLPLRAGAFALLGPELGLEGPEGEGGVVDGLEGLSGQRELPQDDE